MWDGQWEAKYPLTSVQAEKAGIPGGPRVTSKLIHHYVHKSLTLANRFL